MEILVIGGTGVLSSAVVREALKRGVHVTMINRGNREIPKDVTFIRSDKNDFNLIKKSLSGKHFTSVMDFLCYTDEETVKSIRFYAPYCEQYFYVSSCAVYDKTLSGIKEEDAPKPNKIWNYSVNKYKSEERLKVLSAQLGCKYTIIRPCVTYDNTRIPYGIAPRYGYHWTLCARIIAGKPLIRWNNGVNRSNMMRVEDFAVGMVGLIGKPQAYNEEFNVCGDEMPSFNDVLDIISKKLSRKIEIVDVSSKFYAEMLPYKKGEILGGRSMDAINSNDKIKKIVLDFKQTISLVEGISMTIDAYKKQNYQHGIDWKFDAETDRIIKNWCRRNKIDWRRYNLGFIDYLKTATFSDRIRYWLAYHNLDKYTDHLISIYNDGMNKIMKKIK